jgi:hypothetical protein
MLLLNFGFEVSPALDANRQHSPRFFREIQPTFGAFTPPELDNHLLSMKRR